MKTIEQFRARKIEYLQFVLKCPERCGSIDQEMGNWLSDILFIDERFGAWELEKKRLEKTGRFSTFGSRGPFSWGLPRPLRANFQRPYQMECMSIYAEVLYRLGYLAPERLLSPGEWRQMRDGLQLFTQGDWHAADIVERYGPPSLVINGSSPLRRCQSYASTDKELGWIHFDYEFLLEGYAGIAPGDEEHPDTPTIDGKPWYEHPDHAASNPLLRDVRFPAANFEKGLVLTAYAQRMQLNPYGMVAR